MRLPSIIATIGLYVRTMRYLRADQLAHAAYRRVVPRSRVRRLRSDAIVGVRERTPLLPTSRGNRAFGGAESVDALRTDPRDRSYVDWSCPDRTRLWRYHVHYFDFLSDESRSIAWKTDAITNWIDANPPGTPDAWDAYPISLRIVNLVKFFDAVPTAIAQRALRSCYDQARWLERNLERRVLANHYLKNAKALLFAGYFFSGPDAERWRRMGCALFRAQTREQFLADGGHYERSPTYHALGLEDLLDVVNLLRPMSDSVAAGVRDVIIPVARRGLDFFDAIVMPGDHIPLFNDAAIGIGLVPAELFAYADAIIGYRRAARDDELGIASFDASGYYVVRAGDERLIVDCGELGPSYQPGHAHADLLSYELALAGRPVVVDTGVFDYEAGTTRSYARSTRAHNTVTIDGRDQSEMWGVFRIGRRAHPVAPRIALDATDRAFFRGAHDGYANGDRPVMHVRTIRYDAGVWSFEDVLEGTGRRRVESAIHLAADLRARVDGRTVVIVEAGRDLARVIIRSDVTIEIENRPSYPTFGVARDAHAIVVSTTASLPLTLRYAIESCVRGPRP